MGCQPHALGQSDDGELPVAINSLLLDSRLGRSKPAGHGADSKDGLADHRGQGSPSSGTEVVLPGSPLYGN